MIQKNKKWEKFIAFAVLLQSFLVILQQVLIAVFHMPPEATTIYRVVLTAIPLSVAIAIIERLLNEILKRGYLFNCLKQSTVSKYIIEGCIMSLFPRRTIILFKLFRILK